MFGIKDFSSYYKTAIFVIMAILMIFFIGKIADIAIMFFVAFIISASILPLIDKLKKYMPRALAVSLILFLIFAGVLLIIVPLGMLAVNRFVSFTNQLPVYFEQFNTFYHSKGFQDSWARYFDLSTIENLGQYLNTFGGEILNQSLSVGKFIANSITSILMVTIMVFYICIDEAHMKKVYLTFFPPKFKEKASNILDILTTKVGGYVFAQILTMASVGICAKTYPPTFVVKISRKVGGYVNCSSSASAFDCIFNFYFRHCSRFWGNTCRYFGCSYGIWRRGWLYASYFSNNGRYAMDRKSTFKTLFVRKIYGYSPFINNHFVVNRS